MAGSTICRGTPQCRLSQTSFCRRHLVPFGDLSCATELSNGLAKPPQRPSLTLCAIRYHDVPTAHPVRAQDVFDLLHRLRACLTPTPTPPDTRAQDVFDLPADSGLVRPPPMGLGHGGYHTASSRTDRTSFVMTIVWYLHMKIAASTPLPHKHTFNHQR